MVSYLQISPSKFYMDFLSLPYVSVGTKLPGIFTCLKKFTKEAPGITASYVYDKNKISSP